MLVCGSRHDWTNGTASPRTSGASNVFDRTPSHRPAPHGEKKEKEKGKETPSVPSQLAPARLAPHGGPPFIRSLPTNSPLPHSSRTHGGPSYVCSPHKEPVPTPRAWDPPRSSPCQPLADPPTANSSPQRIPIRLMLQHNVYDSATTWDILLQQ